MADILTEITPLKQQDCLWLFDHEKTDFYFLLHKHEEIELNFIENCEGGRRLVGDSVETLGHTDLVLLGSNLEHAWEQDEGMTTRKMREITIQFSPTLLGDELLNKSHFESIRELLKRAKRGVAFGPVATMRAYGCLQNIAEMQTGFRRFLLLLETLHTLAEDNDYHVLSSSQFAHTEQTSDSRRIQKVLTYVDLHFREEIRLAMVANLAGMTETAFSRFFRQHTKMSFSDYLIDKRIGFASRRLIDSSDTVLEVCYDSGFNTLTNFNRIFKSRKGCTPTEFRDGFLKHKVTAED